LILIKAKDEFSNFVVKPKRNAKRLGLLAIPATSTPYERVFSNAGLIIHAKRSRLASAK